jgi:selenocysteine lyase/cysteine desulfurase
VISFKVKGRSSQEIVEQFDERSDYACRFGAFYANRLVEEVLGLDPDDGIVRMSALHYNTEDEVRGYVKVLDEIVCS